MNQKYNDLDHLLGLLTENAAVEATQAMGIPPGAYHSEDFLTLEKQKIFAHDWLCIGREDNVLNFGDYITWKLGNQPIFVIRGEDNNLRAFSNVCLHRMMPLLEGSGNTQNIICPYHAWCYKPNGSLIKNSLIGKTKNTDYHSKELPKIRLETWKGWIYVTLNENALSISKELTRLNKIVSPYQMENYISVIQKDYIWKTNWKILTENFMEGLHLPIVHKKTVGSWFPVSKTKFPSDHNDFFTYQTFTKNGNALYGGAHKSNKRLKGIQRQTSVMPTIFPSHMYVLAPDHLWYLTLNPISVGEVQVRFGISLAPEVNKNLKNRENFISNLYNFFVKVNAEDKKIVEAIFEATLAPLAKAGPLSWLEREIHDFIMYLSRRLNDNQFLDKKK